MPRIPWLTQFQFRAVLVVVLGTAFTLLIAARVLAPQSAPAPVWQQDGRVHLFWHPQCPHCHDAIRFLQTQPSIDVVLHDVTTAANSALLRGIADRFGIPDDELGVPFFVRGSRYLIGFESADTTGRELLALATGAMNAPSVNPQTLRLPLLGDIDPARYSLIALTALMGLADGFNPCAMWVLIYLISLIAGVQEQRKIWWVVGTFVLTSGVLYFLFMTAWLKTFLVVGYVQSLTQAVALVAIGLGADHLYGLALRGGAIGCEVGGSEQRGWIMARARSIVFAPVGLGSLLLIAGLAFTVNAIEFLCSAALPGIYTHMLALMDLSTASYYGYIGLYVTFFMLDDLVIFGLAAFAVQKVLDTRYAAWSRAIGGLMLIGLGAWMLTR